MANIDDVSTPVGLEEVGRRLDYVSIELAELMSRYEPIRMTAGDDAMIFATPSTDVASPKKPTLREFGTTGQSVWTGVLREDYNADLRGKQGLHIYDRMRKSDGQVRGTLRLVKTPVLAARWYMEPASDSKKDQKIADFIWDNLTKWMSVSWPELLTEILLMLDFGYYVFEKVLTIHDGKVIWKKFAPRHPLDVYSWKFDPHGGPEGVTILNSNPEYNLPTEIFIPMWKLALFTFDKEAGDVTGTSVLRPAYKHWFFKENLYKIDAIQKERHGIGIPIIKLPPNFDSDDLIKADEIGRNLRTNEKAHIVLPPNWDIMMLKLEGNTVDSIKSAEHHDLQIAKNILGQFMAGGGSTKNAAVEEELFLKATRYIAEVIRDVFNKYCIPQLVNWNWPNVSEYPELKVRRIGDTVDWRTISFAIRNFIGAGVIIPDDNLEKWVRDEMDLPRADPRSARIIVAPQQAGTIPDGQPDGNPGPGGPAAAAAHQNGGVGGKVVAPPGGKPATPTPPLARLPKQSTAAGMKNTPTRSQG